MCKQKQDKYEELISLQSDTKARASRQKVDSLKQAQIILYGILNLYAKSVKIALSCDKISLAQTYANKPEDFKTKKKLWMRIAKQLFNNSITSNKKAASAFSNDPTTKKMKVEDALAIIRNESHGVLKVEDLLDMFPSEAKVEEMKKHLCSCLEDYEKKILNLRT